MSNPNYPPGTVLPADVDQADVQDWVERHMEEELLDALGPFLVECVDKLLAAHYQTRHSGGALLHIEFGVALADAAKKVANDHPVEIHDAFFREGR